MKQQRALKFAALLCCVAQSACAFGLVLPHTAKAKPENSSKFRNGRGRSTSISSTALRVMPGGAIFPSLKTVAASCILPTCLGFYRIEYGVSYAYGTSIALVAYQILQQVGPSTLAHCHALALVCYGLRLDAFLLYRELFIPRFRKVRESIEEKRGGGGKGFVNRITSRIPFVVGCAALYACMVAPLFLTAAIGDAAHPFIKGCILTTWVGFAIAALGDAQKTAVKASKGEEALVTGGIYALLRHPNYTGEFIGWTASFVASVAAAMSRCGDKSVLGLVAASALGWIGIAFVLAGAAGGLEKKQKEKYGDRPEYKTWIEGSWAGPVIAKK
jgi:steroid 5-alpha reductase family enzyme